MVRVGRGWHKVECLYSYRSFVSGPQRVFWMGDQNGGEMLDKPWTVLLAKRYFPEKNT